MGRGTMKRPAPLRFLWDHHRPTLLLTIFALLVAVFFTLRFVVHAVYWQRVHDTDPMLEPWMTPRYIAKAWDVPPEALNDILIPGDTTRRPTLAEIARTQGRTVEDLITEVTQRLRQSQENPSQ